MRGSRLEANAVLGGIGPGYVEFRFRGTFDDGGGGV